MLAGDIDVFAPNANLIVNGDFETFTNSEAQNVVNEFATARFYESGLVSGFSVADGDGDGTSRINLLTFDNARGTVLDIDSIPNQDDRVFQDVNVEVGQQYLLSFDFFGPSGLDGADPTNDFEVFFNGELLGALSGVERFQQASFVVTGAANDPSGSTTAGDSVSARIEFRDGTSGDRLGDGRGALIDELSLVAVTQQSIVNGSFESNDVAAGGPDFAPGDVAGFDLFTFPDDDQPRVIQIQSGTGTSGGSDGDNFLNLNSSSELVDQVFQDLATEAGQTYYVTFDLRVDPTNDGAPEELRVRFDNQFADTFIGSDQFESFGILVQATSSSSRLTFREAGGVPGVGAGAQIDNVQFFEVDSVDVVDPPVAPVADLIVDANGTAEGTTAEATFEENSGPLNIGAAVQLSHESGDSLNFASIVLVDDPALPAESLSVDVGSTGIVSAFDPDTGVLTLTGRAPLIDYQQVIQSLVYENTSEDPVDRLVGISVTDSNIVVGNNFSPRALIRIEANPTNDAPTLATTQDLSLDFGELQTQTLETIDPDSETFSYEIVDAGALAGQVSVSDAGELSVTGIQAGSFDIVVAVTDDVGARTEQTFQVDVAEFIPFEGVGALSNIPPALREGIFTSPPPLNIDTNLTFDAVLDTTQGEIRIRLLDDESPEFVNSFVNLARDGFYDGLTFHRVLDGFVAQGGSPSGTSVGGPGFQIPTDTNGIEFTERGQLSFANAGALTNGSQFFITFADTSASIDTTNFAVFGNVISGDEVLDQLTRTAQAIPGVGELPIPGAVADVINSIRIEEV